MDKRLLDQLKNMLLLVTGFVRIEQFNKMTWVHVKEKDDTTCNCFVYEDGTGKCFLQVRMEELPDSFRGDRIGLNTYMKSFSRKHDVSLCFNSDGNIEMEKKLFLSKDANGSFTNGAQVLQEMILDLLSLRKHFLEEA